MAEYKQLNPIKYFKDFLSYDIRPDGRKLMEFRPTSINVSSIKRADGSAIVKLGKTIVVCGIKAELAKPKVEEPEQGFIVPNVELPPLCSSQFRPGPPSDIAQTASSYIDELINNSNCINLKSLCIEKDHLSWVLYCDIKCLNFGGSLIDACLMALIAALKTTTLPEVKYDTMTEKTEVLSQRHSLEITNIPVATTFMLFDNDVLLSDPTNEEESICESQLTVVLDGEMKLCSLIKPGGKPMNDLKIHKCMKKAKLRTKNVIHLINTAIDDQK